MTALEIVDNLDEGHPSRQMVTTTLTPLPRDPLGKRAFVRLACLIIRARRPTGRSGLRRRSVFFAQGLADCRNSTVTSNNHLD